MTMPKRSEIKTGMKVAIIQKQHQRTGDHRLVKLHGAADLLLDLFLLGDIASDGQHRVLIPGHDARLLAATAVVGSPGQECPLVLDSSGRLYLFRYWQYEQQVAAQFAGRGQRRVRRLVAAARHGAATERAPGLRAGLGVDPVAGDDPDGLRAPRGRGA